MSALLDVTDLRKARYESSSFGPEMPKRAFELQKLLGSTVKFGGFDDPKITLQEALEQLAKRYGIEFDVSEPPELVEIFERLAGRYLRAISTRRGL